MRVNTFNTAIHAETLLVRDGGSEVFVTNNWQQH
jgi:hypothetical protein